MIFALLVSTLISICMSIMDDIEKKRIIIEQDYQTAQEWIKRRRDFLNDSILRDNKLLSRSESMPEIALKIDKQRKSFIDELALLDEASKSLTAKHTELMKSLDLEASKETVDDRK